MHLHVEKSPSTSDWGRDEDLRSLLVVKCKTEGIPPLWFQQVI